MKDYTNKDFIAAENRIMLKMSWERCWKSIGAVGDGDGLMSRLVHAYNEPQRKYHNLLHLIECLVLLGENVDFAMEPAEVEVALWFHDAVYNVMASDNETQSAEWATHELRQAGMNPEHIARVKDLILATRHSAHPQGQDQMLLVDIDLSILGACRERFDAYERQIRAEYEWVPWFVFSRNRSKMLLELLSRNAIFNTPKLHENLEDQARANLTYSVQKLRG